MQCAGTCWAAQGTECGARQRPWAPPSTAHPCPSTAHVPGHCTPLSYHCTSRRCDGGHRPSRRCCAGARGGSQQWIKDDGLRSSVRAPTHTHIRVTCGSAVRNERCAVPRVGGSTGRAGVCSAGHRGVGPPCSGGWQTVAVEGSAVRTGLVGSIGREQARTDWWG